MKYWIPGVKQVLRQIERQCVKCKISKAKAGEALMGNLPIERQMPYVRAFSYTGIDFCGPFQTKSGRRINKCWILLATCMTTRAIHLEIVEKLNTENTLLRLSDFINRRGLPVRLRSDCASYFKSAKKRLHEILNSAAISDNMSKRNINWVHNCPGTPHSGGAWERLVKCVKRVLDFSMKDMIPTLDIFRSLVINAENLVNNRPLTDESVNLNDDEPLTPNHFLLGASNNWQTPGENQIVNFRKQLNILNALKHRLWKKWINEYIHTLNKRPKWFQDKNKQVMMNEVVLVERNGSWIKGVVFKILPNKDDKIRFLEIKTKNGIIKKHLSHVLFPNLEEGGDC